MKEQDGTSSVTSEPAAAPEPAEPARRGLLSGQLWELEMLISGAVIFALVQLAQALNGVFDRLAPRFSAGGLGALLFASYYAKAILYALIACFLLNLAARAYWAGLLGLATVFPAGVRWERLGYGPITLRVYRRLLPGLSGQIARADRFCSAIFSFTFVIVLLFLFSVVLAALFAGVAWAIDRAFFGSGRFSAALLSMAALAALLMMIGPAVDKLLGKRLDPEGRAARWIGKLTVVNYYAQLYPLTGPVVLNLFSNIRKSVIYPVFYVVFFGLIALVMADFMVRAGTVDLDGYAYLPAEPGPRSLDPRHYENLRPAGDFSPVPWIQADVIRGSYVKLFIPYWPLRHNEAIAERCPGVRPLQREGLRRHEEEPAPAAAEEAVLRCLARLHRVTLGGTPVPGLTLRFSSHPPTGLRGVVAYIPTAGLPRGENVLTVEPVPPRRGGTRRPLRPAYRIPFWL